MLDNEPASETGQRRWWQREPNQRVVAIVVVLLGILTVAQGLLANNATERLTECQSHYANQFADALETRTQATARTQRALDDLMQTVGATLADPNAAQRQRIQRAVADYLALRQRSERQRDANPYPPPPRDACPQ